MGFGFNAKELKNLIPGELCNFKKCFWYYSYRMMSFIPKADIWRVTWNKVKSINYPVYLVTTVSLTQPFLSHKMERINGT